MGLFLVLFLSLFQWFVYPLVTLVITFSSVYLAKEMEIYLQKKDAPCIVIDEIAGFLWTMAFVSSTPSHLILGFIFFRFFDIVKPYPIRAIQNKLPAGWGVVGDDLMAGIYGNLALRIIIGQGL